MRRALVAAVAAAGVGGGLVGGLALAATSTMAASSRLISAGRCPAGARVLPPDAVARAADRARIQARRLYPDDGTAVVTKADRAAYAGARGSEVKHQCGPRMLDRTVVVGLLFPKELPSASLSQGVVFVSLFGTGYQVWEIAH
jgi:hypothetical protein